jgi:hypothetical protein
MTVKDLVEGDPGVRDALPMPTKNEKVQKNAHSMHSATRQPEMPSPARLLAEPGKWKC